MAKAMELITEDDFYRTSHKKIYYAMLGLSEQGEVIDHITLTEYLKVKGELESVGGSAYLAELLQAVPTAANIKYHCRIVRDKALLRGLMTTSTDIIGGDTMRLRRSTIYWILPERSVQPEQGKLGRSFIRVKEIIKESLDYVDVLSKRDHKTVTGVPTGYAEIDELTAGLQPSDLVVIAARPSMGKTSLALGIAQYAAIKHEQVIGIFSLEMSKAQLVLRMLSSEARVKLMHYGRADYKRKIGGAWRKPPENSNRRRFLSTIQAR